MEIEKCLTLEDYRKYMGEKDDKVAFLVEAFKRLHKGAPREDFERTGPRLAGILRNCGRDTALVLQCMWDAQSMDIIGSHLLFITGMLSQERSKVGRIENTVTARCYGKTPQEVNEINRRRMEVFYAAQGKPIPGDEL